MLDFVMRVLGCFLIGVFVGLLPWRRLPPWAPYLLAVLSSIVFGYLWGHWAH